MQSNKKMVEASKISWAASEIQIISVVHPAIRDTIANRCVEGIEKWCSIHPGGKWIMGLVWELQNGMVSY